MLQTIEINVRCLRIKHKRFTQMRQPNYLRRISHLRIGHYFNIVARSGVRKCFKGGEKARYSMKYVCGKIFHRTMHFSIVIFVFY